MCGIFAILNKNNIDENVIKSFEKVRARGPEYSHLNVENNSIFGFHRLSINGINEKSNQPFYIDNIMLICNGEIYNFKKLYQDLNITPRTDSDCEVIIYMYKMFGIEYTLKCLDGVFAFILYDLNKGVVYVSRDPYGVRPLYNYSDYNNFHYFSSNLKGIYDFYEKDCIIFEGNKINLKKCYNIKQFAPGSYSKYEIKDENKFYCTFENRLYTNFPCNIFETNNIYNNTYFDSNFLDSLITIYLTNAVKKRVVDTCQRPIGCLLSGGLDSSLIASLVNKYYQGSEKLKTFSIGLPGSEDLKYAKIVANHLQSDHYEILVSENDFFEAIEDVIKTIESYDTTTVRASVGNYLIGKYIKEKTECKVIFNGDGSDELAGGYLYFNNSPNDYEFDKECNRLLKDICYYDVLRSDRSISEHGLEPRTPFLDRSWVEFYLTIDKSIRNHKNNNNCEKFLIRNAFDNLANDLLPSEILWRTKEAFSDGVSSMQKSWYEIIQDKINEKCKLNKNLEIELKRLMSDHELVNYPDTLEKSYYRYLFNKYYKYADNTIPYFWMPKYTNAKDASARTLTIYKEKNTNM